MSGFAGLPLLRNQKLENNTSSELAKNLSKANADLVAGLAVRIEKQLSLTHKLTMLPGDSAAIFGFKFCQWYFYPTNEKSASKKLAKEL